MLFSGYFCSIALRSRITRRMVGDLINFSLSGYKTGVNGISGGRSMQDASNGKSIKNNTFAIIIHLRPLSRHLPSHLL